METRNLSEVEHYEDGRHVLVSVFDGERTKVRLLCLAPGGAVPVHGHAGFEVTLQPLQGRGELTDGDGRQTELLPGQVHLADGSESFGFKNPHEEPFQLLIHLVKTG